MMVQIDVNAIRDKIMRGRKIWNKAQVDNMDLAGLVWPNQAFDTLDTLLDAIAERDARIADLEAKTELTHIENPPSLKIRASTLGGY